VQIAAAAQAAEAQRSQRKQLHVAACEEFASSTAALDELPPPLMHVRGMRRMWSLADLDSWLEGGGGRGEEGGRGGLWQVMRTIQEMGLCPSAWCTKTPPPGQQTCTRPVPVVICGVIGRCRVSRR
jgi:hypothetical protein